MFMSSGVKNVRFLRYRQERQERRPEEEAAGGVTIRDLRELRLRGPDESATTRGAYRGSRPGWRVSARGRRMTRGHRQLPPHQIDK